MLFFNSVLFYLTEACTTYFFSMKVTWGATAKEAKDTTFWEALIETITAYKYEYVLYVTLLAGYSAALWIYHIDIYRGWAIPCYCAGHILGPIVLNPRILTLSW